MPLDLQGVRRQECRYATMTVGNWAMKGYGGEETSKDILGGTDTRKATANGQVDIQWCRPLGSEATNGTACAVSGGLRATVGKRSQVPLLLEKQASRIPRRMGYASSHFRHYAARQHRSDSTHRAGFQLSKSCGQKYPESHGSE